MSSDDANNDDNHANANELITMIGFGSLLSERSSRLTFPNLINFRLGRVPSNYRRVFGHPASIFFQRNIANQETLEMSSLSIEPCDDGDGGFICSIFEVPNSNQEFTTANGVPSQAFLEREEEFHIIQMPYSQNLNSNDETKTKALNSIGLACTSSTDAAYIAQWGQQRFDDHYSKYGITTIWGWRRDSGLRPCAVYLRHCYLAAKSMGGVCFNSFLDDTCLIDRKTTVREYVQQYPDVLEVEPPDSLRERYSG